MATVILNRCITTSIACHNVLCGLWVGCSMGTASLEAKMLQQLIAMRYKVLYANFLDLNKEFDALDRERCLEIIEVYGVELQARRILHTYWERLMTMDNAGRYYREAFQGFWRVMPCGSSS